jgi:hypothetical protein
MRSLPEYNQPTSNQGVMGKIKDALGLFGEVPTILRFLRESIELGQILDCQFWQPVAAPDLPDPLSRFDDLHPQHIVMLENLKKRSPEQFDSQEAVQTDQARDRLTHPRLGQLTQGSNPRLMRKE